MKERIRKYDMTCIECETTHRVRVDVMHLPGGVRRRCLTCERPTVHTADRLHPGEPKVTYCKSCDGWKGTTDSRNCPDCGAFLSVLPTDESLKLL